MPKLNRARKVSLSSILAALTIALSPLWIAWGPTKAFPAQHLINVLSGIMLGPIWAASISIISGTARIMFGVGTIFAYPGGIPGGVMVGTTYFLLRRTKNKKIALLASALSEPIGTVFIGGTLAYYIIDPLFGWVMHKQFASILLLFYGWAISSIIGSVTGAMAIFILERTKILYRVIGE
ncbi:MAG: energy coupling factor transporter S component ThiW [Nitrososphaeria archaeon]